MKQINTPIKYFLYCRKSSEDKDRQVLSLESQHDEMMKIAQRDGIHILEIFRESKSAKEPGRRPIFAEMIARIKRGQANGILCWKIDRLARNPDEAGQIIGMLHRRELQQIKTCDKDYFSDDNAVISFVEFGIANQFSRDLSKNVKRGIDKKAEMGWRPGLAPLGYLNSKIKLKGEQDILTDLERFQLVKQLFQRLLTGNYTVSQLLDAANEELGLTLPASAHRPSRKLRLSGLYSLLSNPFYYGLFEWPTGSGRWIQGKHEPMITSEEYDRVQILLGKQGKPRPKKHLFAFTGLMHCGSCNAMITAEEKFKRPKNGKVHHYIYYHCTKKKDTSCTEKAIEIDALEKYINTFLTRLTISEEFKNWAIAYLHEIRKSEARVHEDALSAKQKRYNEVIKQLNNLLLKYTAPENSEQQFIEEDEYQSARFQLLKEKRDLENALSKKGREVEEWIELSERTFNFARYAKIWFEKGDWQTKRAIFACLGSNLFLARKNLLIELRKSFIPISRNYLKATEELARLEPLKSGLNKGILYTLIKKFPILSG